MIDLKGLVILVCVFSILVKVCSGLSSLESVMASATLWQHWCHPFDTDCQRVAADSIDSMLYGYAFFSLILLLGKPVLIPLYFVFGKEQECVLRDAVVSCCLWWIVYCIWPKDK